MSVTRWLGRLLRRPQMEADMDEEMAFHRDARIADLIRRGMNPAEAARTARLEFGSTGAWREECRQALGYRPGDELAADLRFAVRGMKKDPGFALSTIVILALAIGVNGVFFSVYSAFVLKPLPIRGAERHVSILGFDQRGRSTSGWSPEEAGALLRGDCLEGLYLSDTFQVLAVAPVQRQTMVTSVSGNYFSLLGGTAALGRTLGQDESEPVAVLSSRGAARFFPGRPNPAGEKLRIRTSVMTVIGVMPPEFTGTAAVVPDLWIGLETEDAIRGRTSSEDNRRELHGILAPDVPAERARATMTAIASHFSRPGEPVARVELRSRQSLLEGDEIGAAAALLFAVFWMVLLIACANLANLHLARALARTHEISMRLSLGASRWRIVRQLLTESMLAGLLGAAAGCALASATVQRACDHAISLTGIAGLTIAPVMIDWRILAYSAILGIAATLLFGMLPGLELSARGLALSNRPGNAVFAGRPIRPRRLRNLLIGGQAAASLVLMVGSGLLIRNIQRLDHVDTGYDASRVYDLGLDRPAAAALSLAARQRGVGAVTAVSRVPLFGPMDRLTIETGGRTTTVGHVFVDHRYFETLGLGVEGRGFTPAEAASRARIAVISRATAERIWPGGIALGQTFRIDASPGNAETLGVYQVAGIVPDVVSGWLFQGKDSSAVYLPAAAGQPGMDAALVRIDGNPLATAASLRRSCAEAASGTGCEPVSLREISSLQRSPFQVAAGVSATLGALALLLTAAGIYSVASYSVVQRRREIGVLSALGASPARVVHRILSEAWRCVALGVAAGMPVCLALSKLAANSAVEIRTFDATAYLAVPALLVITATAACAGPALRAARLDPIAALREE